MSYYSDTDPKIEKYQLNLMRQISTNKKLMMVASLNQDAIELAWGSLRAQYPHESIERLRRRLPDRILGPDLAKKTFGPLMEEEETYAG